MIVYKVTNKISGKFYFGITKNFYNRKHSHKYISKPENSKKPGGKTPFYDAIRRYGWDNFKWEVIFEGSKEDCKSLEIRLIKENKNSCYNLHKGGSIGFSMLTKSKEEIESWKSKLKSSRKGRKPAKGMKHTNENKQLFSRVSREYWDKQETYNATEIVNYGVENGMTKTLKKFGISKTHYYRLKKRVLSNE